MKHGHFLWTHAIASGQHRSYDVARRDDRRRQRVVVKIVELLPWPPLPPRERAGVMACVDANRDARQRRGGKSGQTGVHEMRVDDVRLHVAEVTRDRTRRARDVRAAPKGDVDPRDAEFVEQRRKRRRGPVQQDEGEIETRAVDPARNRFQQRQTRLVPDDVDDADARRAELSRSDFRLHGDTPTLP